jgi:plastin-1
MLGNGVALLELLAAVEPRAVKADLITPGESEEDKILNAKYVLSVARKIGASVYCTWEDIIAVKPKVMLLLVAAIMQVAQKKAKAAAA